MSSGERPTGVPVRRAAVLIVDDQVVFLDLLAELVGATRHLDVAGRAHSGEQGVELARELRPDMVVMDVWMPGMGGAKAAEQIKTALPSTLVVLVSTTHPDELRLRSGGGIADAVIWKGRLGAELLDGIWREHRFQ